MSFFCEKIIDKKALINNFNILKKVGCGSKICAVVKANAYGHNLETVVNILKNKADYFAVANFNEAKKVRMLTSKPILILGDIDSKDILECERLCISISVGSLKKLNEIYLVAKRNNIKAYVHFKVNTGMNRLGFNSVAKFRQAFNKYENNEYVCYQGIFSHIHSQTSKEDIDNQKKRFECFLSCINSRSLIKHIACTQIALTRKDCLYDMCRIGIGLYNYAQDNKYGLKPVLTIKSKIVNIINIKKGECVGYSKGFVSSKNMTVAVVAIGYADGYCRAFGGKAKFLINGQYVNVIGNVCMDMCFCDITNVKCNINDKVVIVGKDEFNNQINANSLAKIANTIDYEILTNFKNDRMEIIVEWLL